MERAIFPIFFVLASLDLAHLVMHLNYVSVGTSSSAILIPSEHPVFIVIRIVDPYSVRLQECIDVLPPMFFLRMYNELNAGNPRPSPSVRH
jgi:hypothetical protein